MSGFRLITPEAKIAARIMPFLTFPMTKRCNFRCAYCGYGGELSASMVEAQDAETVFERALEAHRLGVRKFRLTGGEPFLHPEIDSTIRFFDDLGAYLLVNTNGSLIQRHERLLHSLGSNVHFAVSLDSLDEGSFATISGQGPAFRDVLRGIEILSGAGRLYRLNMVVTRYNQHEVGNVIDSCAELGCDLKLLDVVSVPLPYGDRADLHVSFVALEEELESRASKVEEHIYARSFGTPCRIFTVRGVKVTVKSTWNGSRYDLNGICGGCEHFPCHEGLYDVFSLPDTRIVGCRWSEQSVAPKGLSFGKQLEGMATIFQRATHVPRDRNDAMRPRPSFVVDSLRRAGVKEPEARV